MSLSNTPASERVHIAFFGKRNAGKSSLINAFCGQELSIVSDVPGTTTDPVSKTMELLPIGPVVLIDTPGLDDEGELGEKRIEKTYQALNRTDIGIIVVDAGVGIDDVEKDIIDRFNKNNKPYIIVYNKIDINIRFNKNEALLVSTKTGEGIEELKEKVALLTKEKIKTIPIISDMLEPGDVVVLVIPIDASAPKGRLILPQQLVIRDLLDHGMIPVLTRDSELEITLKELKERPRLVITDSQVFGEVSKIIPKDMPLTSFSILMARHKGTLIQSVKGANALDSIKEGNKILISEGCTHHRQCEDIGTVKLPNWIREYAGVSPDFVFTSGVEFPRSTEAYSLVIHCGGCMLGESEMTSRYEIAENNGTPMTNYGIIIAKIKGIIERSIEILHI